MLFFVNVVDSGVLQTVEQGHFFQIIALKNPARKTWQHIWCPHCLDFPSPPSLYLFYFFFCLCSMMKWCFLPLQAESEQYSVQKSKQDIEIIIFFHLYSFVGISFEDYDFLKSYLKKLQFILGYPEQICRAKTFWSEWY